MESTTFLEIMTDNDGEYTFDDLVNCGAYENAKTVAWIWHNKFMESSDGESFRDEEDCINCSEDEFLEAITHDGMVVTVNSDMTIRRVYRLIKMDFSVKVSLCR